MSQASVEEGKSSGKRGLTIEVQEALKDICDIPSMEIAPDLFVDWGETEKFRVRTAKGECAA